MTRHRGGEVIRRTAHEAAMLFGPENKRLSPRHQLFVRLRHLPGAVNASAAGRRFEGHRLRVGPIGLKVIQTRRRLYRIAESAVFGDVPGKRVVYINGPPVLQAHGMFGGVLDRRDGHWSLLHALAAILQRERPGIQLCRSLRREVYRT